MTAPLNASAATVGNLLSNSTFEIPAYQREYAWEDAEVTEFWSDLSHAISRGPYFLGLIILTGDEKRKQVVDGQQRLLTVTLLAAALRHAALAIGRKALADKLNSSLLRYLDYATDEILPRVILTDPRANKTLQSIIETGSIDEDLLKSGTSSERLWAAYRSLLQELPQHDSSEVFRQLGTWAEFISDQLYVAVFEHPDEASAYSVFEVVNTRGKKLTTADLLKNYVLRKTSEEMRPSRYDQWQAMVEQFEPLGSQNFVHYIRHVVNLRAGYILPKDLYNYISGRGEFAGATVPGVDALMAQLQENLPLYLQLVDPTMDGPAEPGDLDIFVALNELGVTAVRPLMMAIRATQDATAGMKEVLRLTVKRMIVGNLGAGSAERKFAEAARVVYETRSWEAGIATLRDMEHPRQDFVRALTRRSHNRGVLAFIRRSVICESLTPPSVGILQYLRPRQSGTGEWPNFGDEDVAFWGSTVGNVLLVNLDRRPRGASNWQGVKEHLLPNAIEGEKTELLEEYDVWGPRAVERVGSELAKAAAHVWY